MQAPSSYKILFNVKQLKKAGAGCPGAGVCKHRGFAESLCKLRSLACENPAEANTLLVPVFLQEKVTKKMKISDQKDW